MEFKMVFTIFIIMITALPYNRTDKDDIIGLWQGNEGGITVEIYESGGKYYGKIIKAKREEAVNKIILMGFIYSGSGKWEKGKIYAPKREKYYDAEITLLEKNKIEIKAKVFLASKSAVWERAE